MKLIALIKEAAKIVAHFGWRSFGALLVVLGGGAAAGGFTGNVWLGIGITWLATILTALGLIGAVIMFTGKADTDDVATAWRKAGKDLIEKQQDKTK